MRRRKSIRVGFQGEPGAFSEEASRKLLGRSVVTVPCSSFEALFRSIRRGAADCILVPIENSLAGSIQRNYDLLLASRLRITGEVILPIAHHLIGCSGARLRDVRSVQSHPVALAQCERFFAKHPRLTRLAADDTAGSVREVIQRGDYRYAAIAGEYAARVYGGKVLRRHLEDHRRNLTRFVLLTRAGKPKPRANKLSLVFELRHRPGSLSRALEPVASRGFNLLRIESRPIPGRPWEYRFYVDLGARANDPALPKVLKALQRATTRLAVLGHYIAAQGAGHGNI